MKALASWCVRHKGAVLGGWVVMILAMAAAVFVAGSAFSDSTDMPDSESGAAYALMAELPGGGADTPTTGMIAWRTAGTGIDDPGVRDQVGRALGEIGALPGVVGVVSPYDAAGAAQVDASTSTAYATVAMAPGADADQIDGVERVADQLRAGGLDVTTGGAAFAEQVQPSHGGEVIGLIAALIILFVLFRSRWAAGLPILTGLIGVGSSLLAVLLASHVLTLSSTSITMGSLIGLGVGIDYALFIVNRFRNALLEGASVHDAVVRAVTTSGRAVLFAGLTVIVALLGMFVVGIGLLTGMAQAAAITVAFTVLAALTLLPAVLAVLGLRVLSKKQRTALAEGSEPATAPAGGLAARWARLVQRAPAAVAAVAVLVTVVLAAPALTLRIGTPDASSSPEGTTARSFDDMTAPAFGEGFDAPLLLAARTADDGSAAAFTRLVEQLPSVPGVASVSAAPVSGPVSVATVVPTTSAEAEETAELVGTLRDQVIPAAESGTDLQVFVGGATATDIDLSTTLLSKLPVYLGLIAILGFLLLVVAYRSILVPLVGALTNLLTLAVGLGAITAIFQHGYGSELLRVGPGAPVMFLIPVIIVGVMFGLAMDYQVFLTSRMHEEFGRTRDNRRAVRVGLTETARVIAAAALIMLAVFASFGFSGERIVSSIGIGLAIAVAVDAFVVRLALVPALMTLIGRWNWAYPRWADKITPRLSLEGEPTSPHREPVLVGAAEEPVQLVGAPRGGVGESDE